MLLAGPMDEAASKNKLTSFKKLGSNEPEQHTIKSLLKNFIYTDMAIKENKISRNEYVIPNKPATTLSERMKSINEAKLAFLNSTVHLHQGPALTKPNAKTKEPSLHYAQIAIATGSDQRSTGGGKLTEKLRYAPPLKNEKDFIIPINITPNAKKKEEQPQQRKVSFKIKNASSNRRPPLSTKNSTVTVSSNVTELTKKFDNLVNESGHGTVGPLKSMKTKKDIQTPGSTGSSICSPSSTLSSSPNIKIVVRQKRSSKKRSNRKRCSSADSIDKYTDSSSGKVRVIRSKSDGTKIPKSPKKRLKFPDSSDQPKSTDTVDGPPVKQNESPNKDPPSAPLLVKNFIKKFECEIIAHSNTETLTRKKSEMSNTMNTLKKEKPIVPEKKSSLVVTKNIVVKDGVPKIRIMKPSKVETLKDDIVGAVTKSESVEIQPKKEPLYDRRKYKTNYVHSVKMPLKVVEIIHEDISENNVTTPKESNEKVANSTDKLESKELNVNSTLNENDDEIYEDINSHITPNESFLWRTKSSTLYSESDRSLSDSSYSILNISVNDHRNSFTDKIVNVLTSLDDENVENQESQISESTQKSIESENNLDFESNLVEAYNREVVIGCEPQPELISKTVEEDDYEPFATVVSTVIEIPAPPPKTIDRTSKINCPLPEIPKESKKGSRDNIYQRLLEMRSHPEGDESSIHSYEMCANQLEERTRGDGDSDDGYEYCTSPIKPYCVTTTSEIHAAEEYQQYGKQNSINYHISKSVSGASTVSYEKIGSDRMYEKISARLHKSTSPNSYSNRNSFISDCTSYNDGENIYDTIKHGDGVSLSHCYESIPNSPSLVKLQTNLKRQLASAVQKRLSFDTVSNISQSTVSSEQKTNSIYGQRSVISFNGQEITFQVPSSDTSASDRSDEWVDVSDEEHADEQRIVVVRERSRSRKSWSQKVRHQWQKTPKQKVEKVSITSASTVYIDTSAKSSHYSQNDENLARPRAKKASNGTVAVEENHKFLEILEQQCWLSIRTVLRDDKVEIQDLIAFIEGDSSDSGHLYESLEPQPAPAPAPIEDDFDSFDSDSDTDTHHDKTEINPPPERLPEPPGGGGGNYTLTKIASAAQRKMRQLKRNLTKRYTVAIDGKGFQKSPTNGLDKNSPKSPIYANCDRPEIQHIYSNVDFEKPTMTEKIYGFKEELKNALGEKKLYGEIPPPLPEKQSIDKPSTPTEKGKKEDGTLSRKTYFSFKSRFRRASSMAVDINSEVPSALKITNSTFYLTDSMDGDSGFSNCSDLHPGGSSEQLPSSPTAPARRRDGRVRAAESSPCLAPLERPSLPPPPPPPPHPAPGTDLVTVNEELKRLLPSLSRKEKGARTRTSWYAECGALEEAPQRPASSYEMPSPRPSSTSWYAEAGLYQAGNISSSSGASSGSHPASPLPHSLFTHEPLYQFYNQAKLESVCRDTIDSDSDAYESSPSLKCPPLPPQAPVSGESEGSEAGAGARPSAMALVAPRGPARTLWCEVPEVVASTVLSSLAPAQKRLQEAKFELLTSEASYLNSLNVLEAHFMAHPAFREPHILPRSGWETLFSTILPVRKCSQQLMVELERCWQDNILLAGICDIVRRHAERHFQVYVKYCENQALMVRALQRLRETPSFATALRRLESHSACQSLSLHSFLMLPMQRITRLPLLVDAVLKNLNEKDEEYRSCMDALATLNSFVSQCNEGARNTERVEEMFRLARSVEFPPNMPDPPSLAPACARRDRKPVRWLVRSGEMTQLVWKADESKLTFGRKFHKVPLHLFLFNDLLLITKKKGDGSYLCVEHCARSLLEVCAGEAAAQGKHTLLLTLLENHQGRTIEMLMSCPSETDLSRWSEALAPPAAAEGEAVYAGWDCPQAAALYAYTPAQPDELALAEGDVVNVTRKTNEGWYFGERIRDGETGWFPGSYTVEIASPHVRARNLRQRYRLLALSGTYLGQKRRPP